MKIYCSRQINLDNMTDEQIYNWLIGKDLWVNTEQYELSGYFIKIIELKHYPNGAELYRFEEFSGNADYIFDLHMKPIHMPKIVRPIMILTDNEVRNLNPGEII